MNFQIEETEKHIGRTRIEWGNIPVIRIPEAGMASKEERAVALCHELGHLVGSVVGLSGQINDPRMKEVRIPYPYPLEVIKAEEEAWELAERIFQSMKSHYLA